MHEPSLARTRTHGLAFLSDPARPFGTTLAFSEREGGVSDGVFASLNLGASCGDNPAHVAQNRSLFLEALGAASFAERLIVPKQVHGSEVVCIQSEQPQALEQARAQAQAGADAVVCCAPEVPVMLCFADCVPIILVGPGGFAVVHSGWRGSLSRIAECAVTALCDAASCAPCDILAYIGPHIEGSDFEVSADLEERFVEEFGQDVRVAGKPCHLSLGAAVQSSLERTGVLPSAIAKSDLSTASHTDHFFSWRASGGNTGRHAALAWRAREGGC